MDVGTGVWGMGGGMNPSTCTLYILDWLWIHRLVVYLYWTDYESIYLYFIYIGLDMNPSSSTLIILDRFINSSTCTLFILDWLLSHLTVLYLYWTDYESIFLYFIYIGLTMNPSTCTLFILG